MIPKIVAHRGHSQKYPENTLIAFEKAVELGADKIEFDVHFTKDEKIIIHHDYYLGHTDNGKGLIFEHNSQYLKSLSAGKWFSEEFKNIKMPFLEEVFDTFEDKIEYEIELKGFTSKFIHTVLKLVYKYGLLNRVEFTSPHTFLLTKLKKVSPQTKVGTFINKPPEWMRIKLVQTLAKANVLIGNIDVLHCPINILTEEFVNDLRNRGKLTHAADCNNKNDLSKAFDLKVDQLSTEILELALDMKDKYERKIRI